MIDLGIFCGTCWQWRIVKINLLQQIILVSYIIIRNNLSSSWTILILIHISHNKLSDIQGLSTNARAQIIGHLSHRRRRHYLEVLCTIILCHYLATLIPSNICRSNASSIILIVKITILRHIAQRVMIIGNQIYLRSYGRGIVVCLQISTACTVIQLLCHLFCWSEVPQLAV